MSQNLAAHTASGDRAAYISINKYFESVQVTVRSERHPTGADGPTASIEIPMDVWEKIVKKLHDGL